MPSLHMQILKHLKHLVQLLIILECLHWNTAYGFEIFQEANTLGHPLAIQVMCSLTFHIEGALPPGIQYQKYRNRSLRNLKKLTY